MQTGCRSFRTIVRVVKLILLAARRKMDSAMVEIDGSVMEGVSTRPLTSGQMFRAANMLTCG